jgi:hypothetical protein
MPNRILDKTVLLAAILILVAHVCGAQCASGSPTGHFQGTAVSKEAGKLDVSLDLRCSGQSYEGELVTPVGTYTVKTGTDAGGNLQLQLEGGTDSISVQAQVEGESLHGQFTSGQDSGPVELKRVGDAHASGSMDGSLHLTQQEWIEDIDFFAQEIPKRHAAAFHQMQRQDFDAAIADLKGRVPHANADEMYIGLDRIANSIGDAHTYIEFPADTANLPLDVHQFGSDTRVIAAGAGFEKALGARVIKIENTAIGKARELAASITPAAETRGLADARIDGFITTGISLRGFGIVTDRNAATYTFLDDKGNEFKMNFPASAPDVPIRWVNLVKEPPLFRQQPGKDFWFVYLPDSHTLYCNFRGYRGLAENASALLREIKERRPEKLAIDLRQNSGGDYKQGLKYLIEPIQSIPENNRRGHLFVLIGVNTFSAAMSNAAQFRERTAAILVGEPIGERPNSYQEAREMRLPNSKLLVRYSTQYYEFVKGGENVIRPDQLIPTDWETYKAGRDPVLEWVLQYK